MKKRIFIFTALTFAAVLFLGCYGSKNLDGTKNLVFLAPDGGTLLPVAKLFCDKPEIDGGYRVDGEIVTGVTVAARLNAGTCDAAIAPINMCAEVFNASGAYVLAGVASWGNNYIVSLGSVEAPENLTGLYGEVVYAFGKAAVPGVTLLHVLKNEKAESGIKYGEISDPSKPVATQINLLFLQDLNALNNEINKAASKVLYAYLPEPAATGMEFSGRGKIAFDIQMLYEEQAGANYPQAGLVVKKSLLDSSLKTVNALLAKVEESAGYCLSHAGETAQLAKETLQSASLPALAVTKAYIEGNGQTIMAYGSIAEASVKKSVEDYLAVIMPDKAPDAGFYMKG
ncbi:MAG: hypothetical protein FWD58_01875 [Firmicutes bacterium]|nr:hypothetical protein [Bacillota bacterium]